jgi:hypothetical protein
MSTAAFAWAGFALGMVGVWLLYTWDLPETPSENGYGLGPRGGIALPGRPVAGRRDVAARLRRVVSANRVRLGLALALLGFLLQLVGVWMARGHQP